jgi:hypothetical protein
MNTLKKDLEHDKAILEVVTFLVEESKEYHAKGNRHAAMVIIDTIKKINNLYRTPELR